MRAIVDAFVSLSAAERLLADRAFIDSVPGATEALIVGGSRAAADDLARRATVARGATFGLRRLSRSQYDWRRRRWRVSAWHRRPRWGGGHRRTLTIRAS